MLYSVCAHNVEKRFPKIYVGGSIVDISRGGEDGLRMEVVTTDFGAVLKGRLDSKGASEVEPHIGWLGRLHDVTLEISGVDYLSSAGVRVLLSLHKQCRLHGHRLVLVGLQPYCREVLRISGLDGVIETAASLRDVTGAASGATDRHETECGTFLFEAGSDEPCTAEVLGHIENVLNARITRDLMASKRFSAKEFSIGLGGLGAGIDEAMPYLGEMITIGGTMVWLPTDGNDTPDFLVPDPRQESDLVTIRTGFNVSLSGKFNEYAHFESNDADGATMTEIYRALFELARARRPDFRGALGLAMRAEMGSVYGSGARHSPISCNAPENGLPITDPSNFESWFEIDESPRHRDVTGLLCGIGLDADHDGLDEDCLKAAFYLNPANTPGDRAKLHNHGVFFTPQALGEKPLQLEREIARVVELGDFIDMRHLLDRTTVVWALIGICYIQDFRKDLC